MPTRNIHLTDEQDAFVEKVVPAGKYEDVSEAMRDAVRGLQHCIQADELKPDLLHKQLQAGLNALESGRFTEMDDADLYVILEGRATHAW